MKTKTLILLAVLTIAPLLFTACDSAPRKDVKISSTPGTANVIVTDKDGKEITVQKVQY